MKGARTGRLGLTRWITPTARSMRRNRIQSQPRVLLLRKNASILGWNAGAGRRDCIKQDAAGTFLRRRFLLVLPSYLA